MAISLGAVSSGVAVASQAMGVEQEEHRASCQRRDAACHAEPVYSKESESTTAVAAGGPFTGPHGASFKPPAPN